MPVELTSLKVIADADTSGYQRAMDGKVAADQRAVASGDKLAVSIEQTDRRISASGSNIERLARSVDPAYAAQQRLASGTALLQRALDSGTISTDRHAQLLDKLTQRYAPAIQGGAAVAGAVGALAGAARSTGPEVEKLADAHGRLGNTSAKTREGLVLLHEFLSGNYRRAVGSATIELQNFGVMQRLVAVAMNPFVIAGTAAVATFALLEYHTQRNQTQLREFGVILRSTGNDSLATAGNLQQVVKHLRDTGSASADAEAAVKTIARNALVNPQLAEPIATIARDISAATGNKLEDEVKRLVDAVAAGYTGFKKLDDELHFFTAAELTSVRAMAEHGDRAGLLNLALEALKRTYGSDFLASQSEAAKAVNNLTAQWERLLDNLSNTRAFRAVHDALTSLIRDLADVAAGGKDAGAGVGAVVASSRGGYRPGGPPAAVEPAPITSITPGARGGTVRRAGQFLSSGDVLGLTAAAAARTGADAVDLQPFFAARLDAWMSALDESDRALLRVGQNSLFATTGHAPGSAHYFGVGADIGGMSARAAASLGLYGLHQAVPGDWPHVEPIETPSAAVASAAQRRAAFARLATGLQPGGSEAAVPNAELERQKKLVDEQTESTKKALDADRQWAQQQVAAKALIQATNEVRTQGLSGEQAEALKRDTVARAVAEYNIQLQKESQLTDLRITGLAKTTAGYQENAVAGLRAAAHAQAFTEATQRGVDITTRYNQILRENALVALEAGARAATAKAIEIDAEERLAKASAAGTDALHRQQVENQAIAETQDAYNKALATGDERLIALAKSEQDTAIAQARRLDTLKSITAVNESINQRRDQIEVAQLQISLQGRTPEEITAATRTLEEQQRLRNLGSSISKDTAANDLAWLDAWNKTNIALADAQRAQQRLDDGIRSMADTVDNTLTSAIRDAFDGKTVTDWGATIRSTLATIVSQISSSLFLRPVTGEPLGLIGWGEFGAANAAAAADAA